jgi:hypothetical protein
MHTRFDGATPGPWRETDRKFYGLRVVSGRPESKHIATVWNIPDNLCEAPPDARLIISAPDILRVAIQLAEAIEWCSGSKDFAPDGQARLGWIKGPVKALADLHRVVDLPPPTVSKAEESK